MPDESNVNTKEIEKLSTKTWRSRSAECGKRGEKLCLL